MNEPNQPNPQGGPQSWPYNQPQRAQTPQYPGNAAAPGGHPQQPYPNQQYPYGNQQQPPQGYYPMQKPFSTKAIISIVLGGVSVLMYPLAVVTGPTGAIVGWLAMRESRQPDGKYRGWGLALAGVIMSAVMFVIVILVGILFIWVFTQMDLDRESDTYSSGWQQEQWTDEDLELIHRRMHLYFIENNRSLGSGGPVLNEGEPDGLVPDDWPRVTGTLTIADLVAEDELHNWISDYDLKLNGSDKATVECKSEGRRMTVDYSGASARKTLQDIPGTE